MITISIKIWDAVTGDELENLTHAHIVKSVDFSHDDNYLVTASNDKLLRVYDLNKIDSGFINYSNSRII